MKKRALALALTLILCLGLLPTTQAAGPTFTDVPENHWAYTDIEAAAAQGLMKGTGEDQFSPDMKVSVAQFVTLIGRLLYPEIQIEGNDWYGPYFAEAEHAQWGWRIPEVPDYTKAEITRYDMSAILFHAAGNPVSARGLGIETVFAYPGEVADFNGVPDKYAMQVLAAYGMGLIIGDESGNFNGDDTMSRAEVATLMMRLVRAANGETLPTSVRTGKNAYLEMYGCVPRADYDPSLVKLKESYDPVVPINIDRGFLPLDRSWVRDNYAIGGTIYLHVGDTFQLAVSEVPAGYGYLDGDLKERALYWIAQARNQSWFEDYQLWTSSHPEVATVDETGFITTVGPGRTTIQITLPVRYYGDHWITKSCSIVIAVDP